MPKPKYPNVYHKINRRFLKEIWDKPTGHTIMPKTKIQLPEFGLTPKDRIHFFCAFSGEWAKAFKDAGLNVDVSDISTTQLEKLRKFGFDKVSNIPAQLNNLVPEYYDWSISFEPMPLFENKQIIHALRRGLLNKKGIKLIFAATFIYYRPNATQITDFAKTYNLSIGFKKLDNQSDGGIVDLYLVTLETNPTARKNAELDIYVEKALVNYDNIDGKTIISLAKYLGVTVGQILLSLNRLGIKRNVTS